MYISYIFALFTTLFQHFHCIAVFAEPNHNLQRKFGSFTVIWFYVIYGVLEISLSFIEASHRMPQNNY